MSFTTQSTTFANVLLNTSKTRCTHIAPRIGIVFLRDPKSPNFIANTSNSQPNTPLRSPPIDHEATFKVPLEQIKSLEENLRDLRIFLIKIPCTLMQPLSLEI